MSDDAIKAALAAAGDELMARIHCDMEHREMAAITVVAFLRALPPGLIRWGSGNAFDPDDKPTLRQFASKVEKAARDA